MLLTINHQLMGPQHPGFNAAQPAQWQHPDTANSSSIKYFGFRDGTPNLAWAAWYLIWRPNQNGTSKARLIAMDTGGPGYGQWETIAVIDGPANSGPTPAGTTALGDAWYRFALRRVDKYIGFQVIGDGVARSDLWESRLMIEYSITAGLMAKRMIGMKPTPKFLRHQPPKNWLDLEKLPQAA